MSPQFTTLFLLTASFLTIMVLGLEILHPFTASFPARLSQTLEWQTYVHSSALAFGAVLFVLYQVFITLLFALFTFSVRLLKKCGVVVEVKSCEEDDEALSMGGSSDRWLSMKSPLTAILLAVLILNDAVYNRAGGSTVVEGSLERFLAVLSKALPMCIFEIPALIALVYLLGYFKDERPRSTSTVGDLEAQGPSQFSSDVKIPVSGVLPEKNPLVRTIS
ncbi:hypothetical protein VKT23_012634 [Stygiomarasmius scandens]|uniref:Uncharacterized protein n=1 Tax=Marasmiellus scandens TaxID=2682957 RepID=A0ABR1J6U0_9AGAR